MNTPGAGNRSIRLLLVDDQPAVQRDLKMRFKLEPDLEVVGEAGGVAEAISLARALRPDVVLMDVEMSGTDGISAIAALRQVVPHSAVVIFTLYDDAEVRARAREAGAAAFVSTTLQEPLGWNNSTLISENVAEGITRLKQQPGKDIAILGSGALVRSLLQDDLLDELRLVIHPIVLGSAKRLFEDEAYRKALELVDSKTFATGVLYLTYRPARREEGESG